MVKAIFCTVFGSICMYYATAQEVGNLNRFKYAAVETLFYDDDQVDIHGISSMTRKRFIELGMIVVAQNQESWPAELKANPCLLIDCRVTAKDRPLGRQKVVIQGYDCNRTIRITLTGYGNAETYNESYAIALENAFKDLNAAGYEFDPAEVTKMALRTVKTTDLDATSARDYLDNNSLDPIEGIYETDQDFGVLEIVIRKSEDQYEAIILRSAGNVWVAGEIKGYFTKSSIPNVYDVLWSDEGKDEQKTIGFVGENGELSIEVKMDDDSKLKIDYKKTYPN